MITYRLKYAINTALLVLLTGASQYRAAAQPQVSPLPAGEWPGFARDGAEDIKLAGQYAYLVAGAAGLVIADIADPTNCFRAGGLQLGTYAHGIAVSGNYAYLTDHAGLHVIDVSDPPHCARVGGYATAGQAYAVAVSGKYAY